MALCLPRRRRAASLATRPRTKSVASITNHSCFTSAGLALTVVVMKTLLSRKFGGSHRGGNHERLLFHGRCSSDENLLGGLRRLAPPPPSREPMRYGARHSTQNQG